MHSPTLRICLPLILISALAISLTTFLNFGNFERSFDELERSRIDFLIGDLRNKLETGLALGLPLKQLANAQAAIEFEARTDPGIVSISLVDETGELAFHTGLALPRNQLPSRWHPAGKPAWRLLEVDMQIIGVRLASAISSDAGGLVLRYSRWRRDQVLQSVGHTLRLASAMVIVLTALAAWISMRRLLRQS